MSIIKVSKKKTNFTVIDNTGIQDKELSWKAKGLLCYLISLPDDWEINISDLKSRSKDGRDSTSAGIQELIENGYIIRQSFRNEGGQFIYTYTVFEVPQLENRNGKTVTENPKRFSRNGKPVTNKELLHSSTKELNTQIVNTQELNTKEEMSFSDFSNPIPSEQETIEEINIDHLPKEKNSAKKESKYSEQILEVVDYLNQATQKQFKATTNETQKLISGRITEGYSVQDLKDVIDLKVAEWGSSDKMKQYLQPSTLFNQSNFEKYYQVVIQFKANKISIEHGKDATTSNYTSQQQHHKGYRLTSAVDDYLEKIKRQREAELAEFTATHGDAVQKLWDSL